MPSLAASSGADNRPAPCRHLIRCWPTLIFSARRISCTVTGRTLSLQVGERWPSRVRTAAISSSCMPSCARASARSRISEPRVSLAMPLTLILTSRPVTAPPRQTIRAEVTSCSPRSSTTLSIRQRSNAFRWASEVAWSDQICGRRPARLMTFSFSALPIPSWTTG